MKRNEEELARRALGMPDLDPLAEDRARRMLRQRFAPPRHRHAHGPGAGAIAISMLAAAMALVVAGTILSGGNAAARELERLRLVASQQSAPSIPSGEVLHLSEIVFGPQGSTILGSAESYTLLVRYRYDIWEKPDGSGAGSKTYLETGFASPADEATWERLGSPSLPHPGDVVTDRFEPSEAPFYDLHVLSTDPSTLLLQLRSGVPEKRPPGDDHTFRLIGDLLAFGHTTSGQRATLFSVAADLQDVQLVGNVMDPVGRSGVGLAVSGTSTTTMLVFDPDSAELLANETFPLNANLSARVPMDWTAFQPVEVVPSEAARQPG